MYYIVMNINYYQQYLQIYSLTEITRRVANPSMVALWKQFDSVVDCIKKQVTSKQFFYEGNLVQSSRTKQQVRHVQRNKILQSCVTAMEKQAKSDSNSVSSPTVVLSPVAGTSEAKSPFHDQTIDTQNNGPESVVLEDNLVESNEPMDTCPDDETELPPLVQISQVDKSVTNAEKDGIYGLEDSNTKQTDKSTEEKPDGVVNDIIQKKTGMFDLFF